MLHLGYLVPLRLRGAILVYIGGLNEQLAQSFEAKRHSE